MQKDGQTTKDQDHYKTDPLHSINLAVTVVNPKDLTDCRNHCHNRCGVDIAKFKGDKK